MNEAQPTSRYQLDNDKLFLLIRGAIVGLFVVAAAFAATYYWDRYHAQRDTNPAEITISQYEAEIRDDPGDLGARISMAAAYLENGEYSLASQQAEVVLAVSPESPAALLISGVSATEIEEYERAVDRLTLYVIRQDNPSNAHVDPVLAAALYYLGKSHLFLDEPQEAINAFQDMLILERTDADAINLLGQAYLANDQPHLAVESFHEAVTYVPTFLEAYEHLAKVYIQLDMASHAKYAKGMVAYAQADYPSGLAILQQSVVELPEFVPAKIGLGLTYEALGDYEGAMGEINAVLTLEPENLTASYAAMRIQAAIDAQNHGQEN